MEKGGGLSFIRHILCILNVYTLIYIVTVWGVCVIMLNVQSVSGYWVWCCMRGVYFVRTEYMNVYCFKVWMSIYRICNTFIIFSVIRVSIMFDLYSVCMMCNVWNLYSVNSVCVMYIIYNLCTMYRYIVRSVCSLCNICSVAVWHSLHQVHIVVLVIVLWE